MNTSVATASTKYEISLAHFLNPTGFVVPIPVIDVDPILLVFKSKLPKFNIGNDDFFLLDFEDIPF